jgi:hypothetical protein
LFGVLSVFGRRIKGMMLLRPEQMWMCNVMLVFGHHIKGMIWLRLE